MEQFEYIPGLESRYKIGTLGTVLGRNGRPMKPTLDRYGYLRIFLYRKIGKERMKLMVHRLVAITFIPNTENKPQVNHKNRIRTDNRKDNLEWCSCQENIQHSFQNGRKGCALKGESVKGHILKAIDIPIIRQLLNQRVPLKKIAGEYGVSTSTIDAIKRKKNWKHIL